MPELKVSFIFQISEYGCTESYWKNFSSANIDAARDIAVPLAQKRAAMLASDCRIKAIRISNAEDVGRIGQTYYVDFPGVSGKFINAAADALNIGYHDADNQHSNRIQMRGMWDEWMQGNQNPVGDPTFVTLFNNFSSYLIQQSFGWRGISATTQAIVTGYTQAVSGIVTYTLGSDLFTGFNVGTRVEVRTSKINVKSPLNRVQVVEVLAPGACKTTKPIGCSPFLAAGVMSKYSYTLRVIANAKVERVGVRKPGAPLLVSPGRGPVRVVW